MAGDVMRFDTATLGERVFASTLPRLRFISCGAMMGGGEGRTPLGNYQERIQFMRARAGGVIYVSENGAVAYR